MSYKRLLSMKEQLESLRSSIRDEIIKNYNDDFLVKYTHHSTAIEGNTLTLIETKMLIEDGISVGGKSMREIYEVVNHKKAFEYITACVENKRPLDEKTVKDIHAIVMENILAGGIYRNVDVYISGSEHTPPSPNDMYRQIKYFYSDLDSRHFDNPIELAAWTHAEFVKIHPFVDGNGRTARLIMNYQLMSAGFLPVSINKEDRMDYYTCLEEYATSGNLDPFADMVAKLEEERLDKYLSLITTQTAENNEESEL